MRSPAASTMVQGDPQLAKTPTDRRPVIIHLRGELRLEVSGSRVEGKLPGRLGRALLAFLVLNRHRPITRDELMGALWPEATALRLFETQARTELDELATASA
jgi:hypothetical protein